MLWYRESQMKKKSYWRDKKVLVWKWLATFCESTVSPNCYQTRLRLTWNNALSVQLSHSTWSSISPRSIFPTWAPIPTPIDPLGASHAIGSAIWHWKDIFIHHMHWFTVASISSAVGGFGSLSPPRSKIQAAGHIGTTPPAARVQSRRFDYTSYVLEFQSDVVFDISSILMCYRIYELSTCRLTSLIRRHCSQWAPSHESLPSRNLSASSMCCKGWSTWL